MFGIDIAKVFELFKYDRHDKLFFGSSFFFFLFLGLILFLFLSKNDKRLRWALLINFSFFFYYKAIGYLPFVLLGSAIINYLFGKQLLKDTSSKVKQFWLAGGVLFNIGALGYYKYSNFFMQVAADLQHQPFEASALLIPMGISYFTFKALSYLFDIYYGSIEEHYTFSDFLLYLVFFPAVMLGPIDKARDFLPQVNKDYSMNKSQVGRGIFLISIGLIKKYVFADYLYTNLVARVLDSPERFTGVEIVLAVYAAAIQLYLDFSGYTDIGIGIACLMGFELTENFNFPYKAKSVAEFWRRWHKSLSGWLQEYLFTPLQMSMRNLKLFGNIIAIFITFVLCGIWHGASYNFLIWGALHAFFMAFSLGIKKPKEALYKAVKFDRVVKTKLWGVVQVIFTFHLILLAWVFFETPNLEAVEKVYTQIRDFFKPGVFAQFVSVYPILIFLMIAGYILCFTPRFIYDKLESIMQKLPLVVQAEILAVVIWLVTQFRFADMLPPQYFNY